MDTQLPPPTQPQPRQFDLITTIVIILLVIATVYFLRSETTTIGTTTGDNTPSTNAPFPQPSTNPAPALPISPPDLIGSSSVVVKDQATGSTVLISKVTLENPGWVVIHDERKGTAGVIIAATRFNAGTYTNRIVDLLGYQTKNGATYYALLNSDDGDRQFDYTRDLPLKDPLGNMIMAKFNTVKASSTRE